LEGEEALDDDHQIAVQQTAAGLQDNLSFVVAFVVA
jgi:hypothetical protein